MITVIDGNLLEATQDLICHQTNCRGVMGAGVAGQIANKWPSVVQQYAKWCESAGGHLPQERLLGTILACMCGLTGNQRVVNLFGQLNPGADTRYYALQNALTHLRAFAFYMAGEDGVPLSIAIPFGMGCGIGGGDWKVVFAMIEKTLEGIEVVIYRYVPKPE